jgi:hypothetical protein
MWLHWAIFASILILWVLIRATQRHQCTLSAINIFMTEILTRIRRIEGVNSTPERIQIAAHLFLCEGKGPGAG